MVEKWIVQTDRLWLRPFEASDLAVFTAYRNDEAVARYQGWRLPYTSEDAQKFWQDMQQVGREGQPGHWVQWVIERRSDGAMLGDCAFKLAQDGRQAEIGCTLARSFWGLGYALEATLGLLADLFERRGLHRVCANCDQDNLAAARTLEQAGMRREAHFIENLWFKERWSSEFWYALLSSEWHASRAQPNGKEDQ